MRSDILLLFRCCNVWLPVWLNVKYAIHGYYSVTLSTAEHPVYILVANRLLAFDFFLLSRVLTSHVTRFRNKKSS